MSAPHSLATVATLDLIADAALDLATDNAFAKEQPC